MVFPSLYVGFTFYHRFILGLAALRLYDCEHLLTPRDFKAWRKPLLTLLVDDGWYGGMICGQHCSKGPKNIGSELYLFLCTLVLGLISWIDCSLDQTSRDFKKDPIIKAGMAWSYVRWILWFCSISAWFVNSYSSYSISLGGEISCMKCHAFHVRTQWVGRFRGWIMINDEHGGFC